MWYNSIHSTYILRFIDEAVRDKTPIRSNLPVSAGFLRILRTSSAGGMNILGTAQEPAKQPHQDDILPAEMHEPARTGSPKSAVRRGIILLLKVQLY